MWGLFCVLSHVLWNASASSQWQHCGSGLLFRSESCIPVQSWFSSCRVCHQLGNMSGIWEMEPLWGPTQMCPWVFFLFSCTHLSYPGGFRKWHQTLCVVSTDFLDLWPFQRWLVPTLATQLWNTGDGDWYTEPKTNMMLSWCLYVTQDTTTGDKGSFVARSTEPGTIQIPDQSVTVCIALPPKDSILPYP